MAKPKSNAYSDDVYGGQESLGAPDEEKESENPDEENLDAGLDDGLDEEETGGEEL